MPAELTLLVPFRSAHPSAPLHLRRGGERGGPFCYTGAVPQGIRKQTTQQTLCDALPVGVDRRRLSRSRVTALTILHHPDLRRVGQTVRLAELAAGGKAHLSRFAPAFFAPGESHGRPLEDQHLSRSPITFAPGGDPGAVRLEIGSARTRVAADGRLVLDRQSFTRGEVERGVVLELSDWIVLLLHTLPTAAPLAPAWPGLVGESEGLVALRNEIRRVADLDVPVLVRGETGTGKELVARAVHQASRRHKATCLTVNMGAVPPSLAASELFGAVKGAFTGSVKDQPGYFQRAHGGTLFLDEVGETPPEVQVMLLRALETGEVQRVGSSEVQRVDVRLIAATDADLEQAIAEGRFRAPLLHRLSGYQMVLPPLRDRREDLGRLLVHFLREELRSLGEEGRLDPATDATATPWLPASIVARLARHPWPGNVRQLRNAARQIVIDSRGHPTVVVGPLTDRLLREVAEPAILSPADLHPTPAAPPTVATRRRAEPAAYRSSFEVSEAELFEALRANRWEVKAAAAQLGISRPSLYLLMDKTPSLRKASDLSRAELLETREACGGDLEAMVDQLEVSKQGLLQRMRQLGLT